MRRRSFFNELDQARQQAPLPCYWSVSFFSKSKHLHNFFLKRLRFKTYKYFICFPPFIQHLKPTIMLEQFTLMTRDAVFCIDYEQLLPPRPLNQPIIRDTKFAGGHSAHAHSPRLNRSLFSYRTQAANPKLTLPLYCPTRWNDKLS
jgi:hypothetical protein